MSALFLVEKENASNADDGNSQAAATNKMGKGSLIVK
jgi:hypothetical protein